MGAANYALCAILSLKKMINISSIFYMKIPLQWKWFLRLIYMLQIDEFIYSNHYGRCLFSTISHFASIIWWTLARKMHSKNIQHIHLIYHLLNWSSIKRKLLFGNRRRNMKLLTVSHNLLLEFVEKRKIIYFTFGIWEVCFCHFFFTMII